MITISLDEAGSFESQKINIKRLKKTKYPLTPSQKKSIISQESLLGGEVCRNIYQE